MRIIVSIAALLMSVGIAAQSQQPVKRDFSYFYKTAIRSEQQVPPYQLPDVLTCAGGEKVTSVSQWEQQRRPELLQLFTTHMYGRVPEHVHTGEWLLEQDTPDTLGGKARHKLLTLRLAPQQDAPVMRLQLWIPSHGQRAAAAFHGLSFLPNDAIAQAEEWQLQRLMDECFALATFQYTDVTPDKPNTTVAYREGLLPCYYQSGQTEPRPDEWGTVAAWAWAASRAMDYLVSDSLIDAKRVAIIGHSRLGKAALWAGACDQRFAMVFSVQSGGCGATLSRRCFGETIASVNNVLPYWFCDNFKQYSDKEQLMPFDQHELIALIAPRPVYISSASEDWWSDPRGEFLSAKAAEPVYRLYGLSGIDTSEMPPADHPLCNGAIAYHLRTGSHSVKAYDWEQFIDYANGQFAPHGSRH